MTSPLSLPTPPRYSVMQNYTENSSKHVFQQYTEIKLYIYFQQKMLSKCKCLPFCYHAWAPNCELQFDNLQMMKVIFTEETPHIPVCCSLPLNIQMKLSTCAFSGMVPVMAVMHQYTWKFYVNTNCFHLYTRTHDYYNSWWNKDVSGNYCRFSRG